MHMNIKNVTAAIDYIENHLTDKLDLDIVANAVHYSKYHLHRIFTDTVGLTIHDYVQRRKLTEAAKLLVFSDKPIIEIALIAGYESQQAFTTPFKLIYKKSPNQYRESGEFYPLQLRYVLNNHPTKISTEIDWQEDIVFAEENDIPAWMNLLSLVVDGFPYLNEDDYLERLKNYICKKQAMIMKDGDIIIGAMTFNNNTGSIDFLGIHPQYRKKDIAKAFMQKALDELLKDVPISITTFREGDKADLGYRKAFQKLGFAEAELLVEFGYPTQKFTLQKSDLEGNDCE
ncbi:GNAT family N-acetyltransferase [Fusibacter ferrireducens]|uniref:GNAT family N-acetyltransferase n=1 Tax=Fusibacter ferrireducens TaxID=2785058 RepID=A0ABR9ZP03_9FIRM|nr:GNAT family N-acetyltransferase [Fusibacter ferrireducens]MBF4692200.1 GNAT family N-acetyltransferase [Fusibacter ferrireducens]